MCVDTELRAVSVLADDPSGRRVAVTFCAGLGMGSPSLSTSSSSSDDSESEDESGAEGTGRGLGIGAGVLFGCERSASETTETVDARFLAMTSTRRVSADEGGRNDGAGELARLRACASLKAATDILWEESEATLPPLVRGRGGGRRESDKGWGEGWGDCSEGDTGESGETWRKDMRLNDDGSTGGVDEGGDDTVEGWGGLDLVRSLAQENRPVDFLYGFAAGGGWDVVGICEVDSLVGVS